MVRKIKFRGLRIDGEGWAYGYYTVSLYCSQGSHATIQTSLHEYVKVELYSIGQFTGLKDKNGKEIYEGDVVLRSGIDNCVIEWRADRSKYDFKYGVDLMTPQWIGGIDKDFAKNSLEVVGNIHEKGDQNEKD